MFSVVKASDGLGKWGNKRHKVAVVEHLRGMSPDKLRIDLRTPGVLNLSYSRWRVYSGDLSGVMAECQRIAANLNAAAPEEPDYTGMALASVRVVKPLLRQQGIKSLTLARDPRVAVLSPSELMILRLCSDTVRLIPTLEAAQ